MKRVHYTTPWERLGIYLSPAAIFAAPARCGRRGWQFGASDWSQVDCKRCLASKPGGES